MRKKAIKKAVKKPEPKVEIKKEAPIQELPISYLKAKDEALSEEILVRRAAQRAIRLLLRLYDKTGAKPVEAPPVITPEEVKQLANLIIPFEGVEIYSEGTDGKWFKVDPGKYQNFLPGDKIKVVKEGVPVNYRESDTQGTALLVVNKTLTGLGARFAD